MMMGNRMARRLLAGVALLAGTVLAAVNPLPDGYADIIGTVIQVNYQSANTKQNIVGTWLTRNGHAWAMLSVQEDDYLHGYTVDVSINGSLYTNLVFQADYRRPEELSPLPGLDFVQSGKQAYYFPLDITAGPGMAFGKPVDVFLDCVEVGGGHDTHGTAVPVIAADCTLLTVICRYGESARVVEKMLVEIAPETQDERPRGIDRPAGEWRLEQATVNGEPVVPIVDSDGHRDVVRFSPARGSVTSIEYVYSFVPGTVSLWIVDHCDAGDGKIHLAIKPTREGGAPVTDEWIRYLSAANRFMVKFASSEAELDAVRPAAIAELRAGTGTQDLAKGWVWLTVPSPDGFRDADVDGAGRMVKVSILSPEEALTSPGTATAEP